MSQILARLLISLATCQWLYSELLLFYPDVDRIARRVFQVISIPTHDQWEAGEDNPGIRTLAKLFGRPAPEKRAAARIDLPEKVSRPSVAIPVRRVTLSDIEAMPIPRLVEELAYEDLFEDSALNRPFVSGRAVFGSLSDRAGFRTPI